MKVYEIVLIKTMIRKDLAEKESEQELNNEIYQLDKYGENIMFYDFETAMNFYEALEKSLKIELVNGFFNQSYYKLYFFQINELIVDDSVIKKEKIESFGGLNNHKLEIYENTLVVNIIKEKNYTIKDLKNYIKEGK